ncbi:hypothetical protein [Listeria sp. ILCC792]|uniref:hypothetical protein n=1 Tax=Listeria sp. ILCC792 TaxID=1918331 RepID=UPI000B5915F3|nr:hypothetical protein [Listeria sp. ILCC792]
MVEEKIYNGYAFSENEGEKIQVNRKIYNQMLEKYKVYRNDLRLNPDVDLNEFDVVIGREPGYHRAKYNIIKNAPSLNDLELLLLCDSGNLCFGGSRSGGYLVVSED